MSFEGGCCAAVLISLLLCPFAGPAHGEEAEALSPKGEEVERSLAQEEAQSEEQKQRRALATGVVLLRRGHLELEPSFTYAHFSNNNLSIDGFALLPIFVVGQIQSEKVRRDVLVGAMSATYGLLDDLQVEAEVPYRSRSDDITRSNNQLRSAEKSGLGDLRFGLATHLNRRHRSNVPDLIGSVNAFVPTGDDPFDYDPANLWDEDIPLGSGFWSTAAGLTAILPSDPAILFGSLSYTHSFDRDASGRVISGRVDPGETIGYGLGVALALNYQLTLNLQVQHSVTSRTEVSGITLNDTSLNDARFSIGGAWAFSRDRSLHVSIGTGLTEDAPDLIVRVSLPLKFRPFERSKPSS